MRFTLRRPEQETAHSRLDRSAFRNDGVAIGRNRKFPAALAIFALSLTTLNIGCGGGGSQKQTAPVTGIVTCQGEPVAEALVTFQPQTGPDENAGEVGKPATGVTDQEGRYTLSTYSEEDGAVVGKHEVSVRLLPPGWDAQEEPENPTNTPDPNQNFPCRDKTTQVTVEADDNEIDISL